MICNRLNNHLLVPRPIVLPVVEGARVPFSLVSNMYTCTRFTDILEHNTINSFDCAKEIEVEMSSPSPSPP